MDQPKERQQWDKLVSELATEIKIMQSIRHQAGRILYQMKVHLQLYGLDKGRGGRWEAALRDLEIEKSTARDWVVKYQFAENLPPDKCFFQAEVRRVRRTRYSHKYGKNKGAFPALFRRREVEETDARVDPAPDDKQDKSPEQ